MNCKLDEKLNLNSKLVLKTEYYKKKILSKIIV